MADEFATPISKLGQISTREQEEKPKKEKNLSYEDILRHQNERDDTMGNADPGYVPQQPTFQEEREPQPQHRQEPQYYGRQQQLPPQHESQYGDYVDYPVSPAMFQRQPISYSGNEMSTPPPPQPAAQPASRDEPRWWKTWITQNKIGVIATLVIFAVIAFILPKLHSMPRFAAQDGGLSRYVLALVSVAGGSMVSAVNFAV